MRTKLLVVSLTLPVLLIGVGQSLVSIKGIKRGNLLASRPLAKPAQATLDRPKRLPFYLAARDEQKKECEWVGICDR